MPEVTSVDKNGRKSANWKYVIIQEDGSKRESIAKIKFSGDAKDVKANTDNAEYVTQKEFDKLYSEMKFAEGGIIEHGLKKGDKVVDSFYNVVVVENDGERFVVNLNVGKRYTEEKYFSMNFGNMSKAMKE
jgi:hypothetical protein